MLSLECPLSVVHPLLASFSRQKDNDTRKTPCSLFLQRAYCLYARYVCVGGCSHMYSSFCDSSFTTDHWPLATWDCIVRSTAVSGTEKLQSIQDRTRSPTDGTFTTRATGIIYRGCQASALKKHFHHYSRSMGTYTRYSVNALEIILSYFSSWRFSFDAGNKRTIHCQRCGVCFV